AQYRCEGQHPDQRIADMLSRQRRWGEFIEVDMQRRVLQLDPAHEALFPDTAVMSQLAGLDQSDHRRLVDAAETLALLFIEPLVCYGRGHFLHFQFPFAGCVDVHLKGAEVAFLRCFSTYGGESRFVKSFMSIG